MEGQNNTSDGENIPLSDKVDALTDPAIYPDHPDNIDVIETHFAFVFLSRELVYKLKKPIRVEQADFTTLKARRANSRAEIELNRRLAADVYLEAVPLTSDDGRLVLDGDGAVADWLVKMRRLPEHRMLDNAADEGRATPADIDAVMRKLSAFYRRAPGPGWPADEYVDRLHARRRYYRDRLLGTVTADGPVDRQLVAAVTDLQKEVLVTNAAAFARRAADGRIVDAHGDLKPEHVCLLPDPQIIDCLEISEKLRLLDTAEEVAFLNLECIRLGHAALAETIRERYRAVHDDAVPWVVWRFGRSMRALVRAFLSAVRLEEESAENGARYAARATWYLEQALSDLSRNG